MPDRYLALSPEQGGACFGPFSSGTLCLGTDNRSCQVVLGALPGLRPIHLKLTISPDGRGFLEPADRATQSWLLPGGQGPGRLLDSSAMLRLGDAIVLGTPQGPKFFLVDLPPLSTVAPAAPPPPPGAGGVTGYTRRDEAFRAPSRPSGVTHGIQKVKEERSDRPLYFLVGLAGVLAIFASTCAGLGLALWHYAQR